MATRQRAVDRGTDHGRRLISVIGREARNARMALGLTQREVADAVGLSASEVSRIERGLIPNVSLIHFARILATVGLELSAKTYPAGEPIRDKGHAALLGRFRSCLHRTLAWRVEVPLPMPGDQRAWDATVSAPANAWRYGVEAETSPTDGQALLRRLALKGRDGAMDGVILLLPETRRSRAFRRVFAAQLAADFPVPGRRALELLAAGVDPGGNAVVVR